jgi:hypothetical protein
MMFSEPHTKMIGKTLKNDFRLVLITDSYVKMHLASLRNFLYVLYCRVRYIIYAAEEAMSHDSNFSFFLCLSPS